MKKTTFADAFKLADDVLYSGVRGVTDLMVMPGLINLDFADVKAVMCEMGKAMMGTGEAEGEKRAQEAAEAAISNPLLDNVSMKGARGVLINITGGSDMTLFEVDEAANRIREEVDSNANIIFGSTFNESLEGKIRVSVVATGIGPAPVFAQEREAEVLNDLGDDSGEEFQEEFEEENIQTEEVSEGQSEQEAASNFQLNLPEGSYSPSGESDDFSIEESDSDNSNVDSGEEEFSNYNYANAARLQEDGLFSQGGNFDDKGESRSNLNQASDASNSDLNGDDDVFVSPEPVIPNNYIDSGMQQKAANNSGSQVRREARGESDSNKAKKGAKSSGGLFSRVAKVARSFQSSDKNEELYNEKLEDKLESEENSENSSSDESLDVPAFLRRKA